MHAPATARPRHVCAHPIYGTPLALAQHFITVQHEHSNKWLYQHSKLIHQSIALFVYKTELFGQARGVLQLTPIRMENYGNTAVKVLGMFHAFLRWKDKVYKQLFYVTDCDRSPNLLSRDACYTLGVVKPCYTGKFHKFHRFYCVINETQSCI